MANKTEVVVVVKSRSAAQRFVDELKDNGLIYEDATVTNDGPYRLVVTEGL